MERLFKDAEANRRFRRGQVKVLVGDRSNSRKFLSLGIFLCLVVNVLFRVNTVLK